MLLLPLLLQLPLLLLLPLLLCIHPCSRLRRMPRCQLSWRRWRVPQDVPQIIHQSWIFKGISTPLLLPLLLGIRPSSRPCWVPRWQLCWRRWWAPQQPLWYGHHHAKHAPIHQHAWQTANTTSCCSCCWAQVHWGSKDWGQAKHGSHRQGPTREGCGHWGRS
jgi:hypothetical protein